MRKRLPDTVYNLLLVFQELVDLLRRHRMRAIPGALEDRHAATENPLYLGFRMGAAGQFTVILLVGFVACDDQTPALPKGCKMER